jgi:site-specific recombinase XerD
MEESRMENKIKGNSISELAAELDGYLLAHGYSQETLKPFRQAWRLVADCAAGNHHKAADAQWIMPFMRIYCKSSGRKTENTSIHACKLLCDFQKLKLTGVAPRWMADMEPQSRILSLGKGAAAYLASKNYPASTIRHYRHVWNQMADYAYEHDFMVIEDAWVETFLREHYRITDGELSSTQRTHKRAALTLKDFQTYGDIPNCGKRAAKEKGFAEYQCFFDSVEKHCSSKNYSASTRRYHQQRAYHLALFLSARDICFQSLNVQHMREYFLSLSGLAASTVGMAHYVLRNILCAAYEDGHISTDLSLICEKPRTLAGSKIPSAYPSEDVQALLDSVDRESPTGKRDYAILLLGARLGLRAGDIRTMTFENLHWDTHEIRIIQEKTKNEMALPLSEEVGWAIIDYLKNGRPLADSKCIFVRHRAPYTPFGPTNSLGAIIGKYFRRANVRVPEGKKHGMHILRHSLASNMLAAGVPLPVLTGVFDHADGKTTMQYLKVDISQLRVCALETENGGDR